MQQQLLDGLLQGLLDPRFQGLISEFYSIRTRLSVQADGKLLHHIQALLHTLSIVLQDQQSLRDLQSATGDEDASTLSPDVDVPQVLACMESLHELVSGPAFTDTATVLFILCGKLQLEPGTSPKDPTDVLRRLDDFLGLIGLREVSILQLWDNATGDLVEQRQSIFSAVMDVLTAVQGECSVEAA